MLEIVLQNVLEKGHQLRAAWQLHRLTLPRQSEQIFARYYSTRTSGAD